MDNPLNSPREWKNRTQEEGLLSPTQTLLGSSNLVLGPGTEEAAIRTPSSSAN